MKVRVHWLEERHFTAEVEIPEVTMERAEAWLLAGHPRQRDRMEIAEAQQFMTEQDALIMATMPDVPMTTTLIEQSVIELTELDGG